MAPHPLRRLATSGAAYQAASLVAGVLALVTLPLYTRHLTPGELGAAETLLTWIILASIVLRSGLQEALLRHWFLDADPVRRSRLARKVTVLVLGASTGAAALVAAFAEPISELLLGEQLPGPLRATALGIWAFTNLEVANALLRAQEQRRIYLFASLSNVLLTVTTTIGLVVILDQGASGYLLGNYAASTVVLVGVWWTQRALLLGHRAVDAPAVALRPLLRFGLPTVPPEIAVFALNLIDRQYLIHTTGLASNGIYSAAVKLATIVIVVARAFQAAWPPLAYDLGDEEAPKAYAHVVRAYVLLLGLMVAGLTLFRHQVVTVLVAEEFAAAAGALPWLALGWALWGLTWVFTSIAGREHQTGRTLPAALIGLVVNVAVLVALVPSLAATGAAIALVAAYVVALTISHLRTRTLLRVPFEWSRLVAAVVVLTVVAVGVDWLAPPSGVDAVLLRAAAMAAIPLLLLAAGAFTSAELRTVVAAIRRRRR
ncbi:MAG: lipopolysaccharide biosynthesis protein [Patulibacter sp.]|nr:lipopolysaccharide biosynthesis protein [Patulibacter sp.]